MKAGTASKENLLKLRDFVSDKIGIYFPEDKLYLLENGIERAVNDFGYRDIDTCINELLKTSWAKKEIQTLASYLTTGETYFFRHSNHFLFFTNSILKAVSEGRRKSLKIWSAGCCTGEEPYSLVITLLENISRYSLNKLDLKIIATDINPVFLRKAREGVYTEYSFRETKPEIKKKYFTKISRGKYQLGEQIMNMVDFRYLNLADNTYQLDYGLLDDIDLIFCRNVFIYFKDDLINNILHRFGRCLKEDGFLVVAPAETIKVDRNRYSSILYFQSTIFHKVQKKNLSAIFPPETSTRKFVERKSLGKYPNLTLSSRKSVKVVEETDYGDVLKKAEVFFNESKYVDSEKLLNSVIDKVTVPALKARMYLLLSQCYANSGDIYRSLIVCEKALAADSLYFPAYYLYSTLLIESNRNKEAVNYLKKALYLNDSHIMTHFMLANAYRNVNDIANAERFYGKTLSLAKKIQPESIIENSEGITAASMVKLIEQLTAR